MVQTLELPGNELKDNGAMILGRAMREMSGSHVTRLNLSSNNIEEDGAFIIANVRAVVLQLVLQAACPPLPSLRRACGGRSVTASLSHYTAPRQLCVHRVRA